MDKDALYEEAFRLLDRANQLLEKCRLAHEKALNDNLGDSKQLTVSRETASVARCL